MLLAKGFGKIQAVVETDRIGNGSDGQVGVLQKITSLLHAKIRQIFLGRLADHVLEGSEQVASAQTHIGGNILHGNGVGVIGADVFDTFLHIGVGGVLCFLPVGALNEKGQGRIQASGHFHCVLKLIASGIVDMKELPLNVFAVFHLKNAGRFLGEIRRFQNHCGITSRETDPGVFPWFLRIGAVDDLRVRIYQKGVTGGQIVGGAIHLIGALAGDDIVNEIVIPDSGPPVLAGIAVLIADVVDRQGYQFLFRCFIRILVFFLHDIPPVSFLGLHSLCVSIRATLRIR